MKILLALILLVAFAAPVSAACDSSDGTTYFTVSFVQGPRGYLSGMVLTDCSNEYPPELLVPEPAEGVIRIHVFHPTDRDELGGWRYTTNLRLNPRDKIFVRVPGRTLGLPCLPSSTTLQGRKTLWCVTQEWF